LKSGEDFTEFIDNSLLPGTISLKTTLDSASDAIQPILPKIQMWTKSDFQTP
jgi:hypothetical protein